MSNITSVINDLFTVAIKNNNIFIQIKDENNNIIYPSDFSTLSRIDSILKIKNFCTPENITDEIQVYDEVYNRYYKIKKLVYPINGKYYSIDVIEDISKLKYYQNISEYDVNTEIYNARTIMKKMEECIVNKNNDLDNFSIAICDIDDFKKFNDTYSHLAGDLVLKTLANIFKKHVKNGYVGRYGGDEFVLIFKNYDSKQTLEAISNIMEEIKSLKLPYKDMIIENISISCGISDIDFIMPYNISTIEDIAYIREKLFYNADQALYDVKENGKGIASIYKAGKQKKMND
jgi:diguanylate cyclase (GGDEF)-like protein